ncbi:putative peptide-transporting ATPase [Helianthus annuus]|uniref:Peptide-transporting ATPase n=1 Tax=Helianthus annuus TaxID=4232 RepID=A0A251TKM9_HELAN|nr:putative peptide-transporting ATPase [Helianthus annuus]KAJ0513720.1 putative bacterial ABC-type protein transporter [Helianthus annuus]KAJ0529824.1 putative bacterial ABC-type protein transporter [Helianthus annuus]KAJ0696698.1 putative bacterial ABC-type protein transporter [Helianthus annuus]
MLVDHCSTASLERLTYYGISSNLLLYFTGELDQHCTTASRNLSNWPRACYITPLFRAFLADGYIGKYWTIASSSILYAIAQTVTCFTSLYLVALASGGIKACISAYGADQDDEYWHSHRSFFDCLGTRLRGFDLGLWYTYFSHGSGCSFVLLRYLVL